MTCSLCDMLRGLLRRRPAAGARMMTAGQPMRLGPVSVSDGVNYRGIQTLNLLPNVARPMSFSASTTSFPWLLLINLGEADAYFALGSGPATTADYLVPVGGCYVIATGAAPGISAIAPGGHCTLRLAQADSQPQCAPLADRNFMALDAHNAGNPKARFNLFYTVIGDGQVGTDGAMTIGGSVLTAASGKFTSGGITAAKVGQPISIEKAGANFMAITMALVSGGDDYAQDELVTFPGGQVVRVRAVGSSFTGSISGTTLTVSAVASGVLAAGQRVYGDSATNGLTRVLADQVIVQQLTGSAGSTGTYEVTLSQTASSQAMNSQGSAASITGSIAGTTLTVSAVALGTIEIGAFLNGDNVSEASRFLTVASQTSGTPGGIGVYELAGTVPLTLTSQAFTTWLPGGPILALDCNGNRGFDMVDPGDSATNPATAQTQSSTTGIGTGAQLTFTWQHVNLVTTIQSIIDDTHLTLAAANASGSVLSSVEWGFGTDRSSEINDALALGVGQYGERVVRMTSGVVAIASPISYASQNSLQGVGRGSRTGSMTMVIWVGPHRGTMLTNSLADDPTAAITGPRFEGYTLNGMGAALKGMVSHGDSSGFYSDLSFIDMIGTCWDINASSKAVGSAKIPFIAALVQNINVTINRTGGRNTRGMVIGPGTPNSDSNRSTFINLSLTCTDGASMELGSSDSLAFINFWGASNGIGQSLEMMASQSGLGRASDCYFYQCQPISGTLVRHNGYSRGIIGINMWLSRANAAPNPVIETGAEAFCLTNKWNMVGAPGGAGVWTSLQAGKSGLQGELYLYPATAGRGFVRIDTADHVSDDQIRLIFDQQAGPRQIYVVDQKAGTQYLLASGATRRTTGLYDALRLPLSGFKNTDGSALATSSATGKFAISVSLGTAMRLFGANALGNTQTSGAFTEVTLPPWYIAGADLSAVVRCGSTGAGVSGTRTVEVRAYLVSVDGTMGANIGPGAAQAFTGGTVDVAFTITGTTLVPGSRLLVLVETVLQETGGSSALSSSVLSARIQ